MNYNGMKGAVDREINGFGKCQCQKKSENVYNEIIVKCHHHHHYHHYHYYRARKR